MWFSYQPDFWGHKVVQRRWIIKSKYAIILALPPPLPGSLINACCHGGVSAVFLQHSCSLVLSPPAMKRLWEGRWVEQGCGGAKARDGRPRCLQQACTQSRRGQWKHSTIVHSHCQPLLLETHLLTYGFSLPSTVWCLSSFVRLNLNFAINKNTDF